MIEREVKEGDDAAAPVRGDALERPARREANEHAILAWVQAGARGAGRPGRARRRCGPTSSGRSRRSSTTTRRRPRSGRSSTTTSDSPADDTLSCASCHDLAKGGTDNAGRSRTASAGRRAASTRPTTFNAALNFVQFWDGRAPTLEAQAGGPPMNPVEMGSAGWTQIVEKLNKDKALRKEFEAVYPEGFGEKTITGAIAEFERTLVTPNSRFDKYLGGRRDGTHRATRSTATSCSRREGLRELPRRRAARRQVVRGDGPTGRLLQGARRPPDRRRQRPLQRDEGRAGPALLQGARRCATSRRPRPTSTTARRRRSRARSTRWPTYQVGAAARARTTPRTSCRFLETLTGEYKGKAL